MTVGIGINFFGKPEELDTHTHNQPTLHTMKKSISITVSLLATLTASQGAVSFLNSLQDNPNTFEIGRWSRTSVVKSHDIDGDNYYGTDGFFGPTTVMMAAEAQAMH